MLGDLDIFLLHYSRTYLNNRTSVSKVSSIAKHLTCSVIEANPIYLNNQTKGFVIEAANQRVFGY